MKILFVLGVFASLAAAMVCEGDLLDMDNQWKLICSFNFEMEGGAAEFNITSLHPWYRNQRVALYHDFEEGGFADIAKATKSCEDKLAMAKRSYIVNRIGNTGFKVSVTSTQRSRFWYVVITNCGPPGYEDAYDYSDYDQDEIDQMLLTKKLMREELDPANPEHPFLKELGPTHKIFRQEGLYIKHYRFHLTNDGGKFKKEFSYSDQGIFEAEIFCLLVLLLLLPLSLYLHYKLSNAGKLNASAAMRKIMCLEGIAFLDTVICIAHYDVYSRDGVGYPVALVVSELLNAAVHFGLVATFCFMAKGMWLDPQQFSVKESRTVMEVLGIYLVLTVLLLWHAFTIDDPIKDDYIYNTIPGFIIAGIRTVLAVWFTISIAVQICRMQNKSERNGMEHITFIYAATAFVGAIWMLSPLMLVLIGNLYYAWERMRYMVITEALLTMVAFCFLNPILYFNSQRMGTEESDHKDGFSGIAGTEIDP